MSEKSSYKQIIKSTGIIGGSQVITILVGIASTKIVAILLGPVGVGIAGIYQATLDLIRSATGFGIEFSAVRDVAEAAGTEDNKRISRIITVLRRWAFFTGLLGLVIGVAFCRQLSMYAFGNESYAAGIAILSVTLLIAAISEGQGALLQGMRRIGDLAKTHIYGVVLGFIISMPLYYLFGLRGIVPALALNAVAGLLLTWWFARKVNVEKAPLSATETFREGLGMAKLGFFTVITGLFNIGAMYLVRIYISNKGGLESVGVFLAAWKLSSMYLGSVLGAMAADYYPRLSAVNKDNTAVNKLVNEQVEITVLVASPLIIGMITFVHVLVPLFYSGKFVQAVTVLQWQLMGDFLKILSWPLGFIILAKARGGVFIFSEFLGNFSYLLFVFLGWDLFGLEVAGMAFLGMYVLYLFVVYFLVLRLSGFVFMSCNLRHVIVYGCLIFAAFCDVRFMSGFPLYFIGVAIALLAATYSYYRLNRIFDVIGFVREKLSKFF